jgi:acetolactate synthase-like protein
MRHKRGQALAKADFVLLAGVPADFRLDYGRHINIKAFFATVNLCRVTLSKNNDARRPNVKVLGDSVAFIRRLSEVVGLNTNKRPSWRSFLETNEAKREKEIDDMAAKDARREHDDDSKNFIGPIRLCREIDAAIGEDSIIVADGIVFMFPTCTTVAVLIICLHDCIGGDFVGTASYIVKPRGPLTWLDPGVFGTLGVGGGFALAAKCARPKSEVWILYGDGASGNTRHDSR